MIGDKTDIEISSLLGLLYKYHCVNTPLIVMLTRYMFYCILSLFSNVL